MCFCHCILFGVLSVICSMTRGKHTPLTHMVRHRIRQLRLDRNLSQIELSELAGISSDSVNRIESGSRVPSLDTLEKIALVFEMPVSTLVRRDELPKTKQPPSLMRIIYLLRRHSPNVHKACEKLLRSALKGFLDSEIAQEVLKDSDMTPKKVKPKKR